MTGDGQFNTHLQYRCEQGQIFNSLLAMSVVLTEHKPGDGGFCVVSCSFFLSFFLSLGGDIYFCVLFFFGWWSCFLFRSIIYLREVVILVVAVLCVHPALSLYSSPLISTLKVRGSHKMKFPVPDEMMNGTVQIEGWY